MFLILALEFFSSKKFDVCASFIDQNEVLKARVRVVWYTFLILCLRC